MEFTPYIIQFVPKRQNETHIIKRQGGKNKLSLKLQYERTDLASQQNSISNNFSLPKMSLPLPWQNMKLLHSHSAEIKFLVIPERNSFVFVLGVQLTFENRTASKTFRQHKTLKRRFRVKLAQHLSFLGDQSPQGVYLLHVKIQELDRTSCYSLISFPYNVLESKSMNLPGTYFDHQNFHFPLWDTENLCSRIIRHVTECHLPPLQKRLIL